MTVLQILIRYEVLDCSGLVAESGSILMISLALCLLNACVTLFMISVESKALQEPYLEFILNSFKARQGWIPFMHQIEKKELKQAVEYGCVRCSYPTITDLTGLYKTFQFQFSDTSLQVLTSELVKWGSTTTEAPAGDSDDEDTGQAKPPEPKKADNGYNNEYDSDYEGGAERQETHTEEHHELIRNKYIIDMGGSVGLVSINSLLHFYHLTPKNRITLRFTDLDWDILMSNARKSNLIYNVRNSDLREARTPSGLHLLWICVEDERADNPSSKELFDASYNLNRKMKLAVSACRKLQSALNSSDSNRFVEMIEKFDPELGDQVFLKIQEDMDELLITQNFLTMKKLAKMIKKANNLFKEIEKYVKNVEETHLEGLYEKLNQIVNEDHTYSSFGSYARVDAGEELTFCEGKLLAQDLTPVIREAIENYKAKLIEA